MHIYTDAEKTFLREYTPGHSHAEIQAAFTEKFGWGISINQVKTSIVRYHLNTGRTGRFEKGNIPVNKGQKMSAEVYEKSKRTMFKKGHTPANYKPIGSERVTKDGYVEVKVRPPNVWKLKHRVIWESVYGEIPKGHIIIFRDGDRRNLDINNLILIKREVNAVLNHTDLGKCTGDLKEAAIKLAELKIATHRKRKERKNE